jgi:LytS/YehU family sensor histidine kinase
MSVVTMLSAFYLTMNLRMLQQVKDVQLRAERLENQALKGQFEALNSLSILTSLIHEDTALSERFVRQLSKTYRYILDQRNQDLVLLKTELDFIRSYTFLLQIRFEQKFEVLVDVPERLQVQYQIAPLTLQLLVENAVKHNRMSIHERLQIRIYVQDDWLLVANVLQPRDRPESSTGVGLQNIVNRYSMLTKRPVTYGEAGGEFIVSLPLLVNNGALQNAPDTTVSQLES